ncbi:MAG: exodeoxyribonuclease V subunit gamma, partial [Clostridia bacterium]|nr:exodeoxyribonuclease V subunit gamma [Clostridia bacterium]
MKIVISNTSHGAYKGVVQEIKSNLKSAQESIVLAPDRFTAFVERGLISTLELESSFGLEVMSFTRLANKLIGRDIKKCLTPEGSVMLISKVILDVKDKLCYYKSVAKVDGFATELYAALTALRNSGATVESLKESAEKMEESPLKTKLMDIATIYEEYLVQLEVSHTDSSTRLIALASYLASHPEAVAGKRFYCTDIYEFSAPELEILKNIDKYAMSLTIGVTSGYDNPNKRIYPDRVIQKLKSVSDGRAEIVRNDEALPPATDGISRWLFSYSKPKTPIENVGENGEKKVYLRVAKDRYDEILKLATDVIHHVRSGGRYKDIEVFASDLKSYEADIKAIFARYNIPFFIDEKELLSEQTKVRYLLSALAVVKSGFKSVEVLDFCKNPLFASKLEFGEEEVYLFENYVLKHSVEYSRFFSPFEVDKRYASKRLKEHKKEFNFENVDEKLRFLLESEENVVPERVRRKLVETLSPITIRGSVNVKDIVAGVRRVLEDSEEAWLSHVEKLAKISKFYEKCAEQVDEKIDAVLDEIDDVIQGVRTVGEFETILSSMIKTLKIALVPTYLDCVFVGSYDSRFMGGRDVYILGAVSGKLPSTESGGIVIGTNDEEALKVAGIEVSPTSYQKVMTNMYAVCDLMKKPHGKLVISRPEIADGASLQPSVVLKELQGFLAEGGKAIEEERIDFEHLSKLPTDERESLAMGMFATKRGAYHEILKNAMPVVIDDATSNRILPEELEVYSSALETLSCDEKSKLDGMAIKPERIETKKSGTTITSVSRLEKFYACPYQHYFAYVLSLKKRQEGEFLGTENGTIIHSVLEQLFNDIRDGKVDVTTIEDRVKVYFDNAIKEGEYEYLLEKPQTKRVLARVQKESLSLAKDMYALSLRSEFAPYLMEAAIGKGEIKPMAIKVGENEIKFKGVIDRIDVRGDDFLIVDYKTYRAKLELKDIYYGQKIQLYL